MDSIGIYVHIPYCRRKCLYCDFYSEGVIRADWKRYVDALLAEFRWKLQEYTPVISNASQFTLYIGGGTPSLIPPEQFTRLAHELISMARRIPDEFTIEVNPDDVTEDMAPLWHDCNVNRVSMGIQSLVDRELQAIGRRHDAITARKAFDILRSHFDNISLDIIFGLPYQTPESLNQTLDGILQMYPEHISAYSLMFEERTALTRLRNAGQIAETNEDISLEMFRNIAARLSDAGYEQYEISNYSRPGYRSRHNSSYWKQTPYIGLGAGAHSYDADSVRTFCLPDARQYMSLWNNILSGCVPDISNLYEIETLSEDELREEMIMTRLRTVEGLNLREFGKRFGLAALQKLTAGCRPYIQEGLLRQDNDCVSLTRDGVMRSDEVICDLF